ncbi:MAG: hypothetical protein QMB52_08745 [Propionivibrio sp.]
MRLLPTLLLTCAFSAPLAAQEPAAGSTQRIATRDGVTVPIYVVRRADAVATLILYSGGGGGYGKIGADGWPTSGNFLIRTGKIWAKYPFNVVMVGRPSDGIDLELGGIRAGNDHATDNLAIFKAIKHENALPLWLVGTSMGTISVAAAAIRDEQRLLAGIVLSSSIVAYKIPGAVPSLELEEIRVPTLVFHHENDACWACRPDEAKRIETQLTNAPIRKTLLVNGGSGATGNACGAFHHHGYIGMEEPAVDLIAGWILKPSE